MGTYLNVSDDEVDKFHSAREKILFEGDSSEGDSLDMDSHGVEVFPLPSSEEEDAFEEGEEDNKAWGRKRRAFYSTDNYAKDEETSEALRLQNLKLGKMKEEDFSSWYRSEDNVCSGGYEEKTIQIKNLFSQDKVLLLSENNETLLDKYGHVVEKILSEQKSRAEELNNHLRPLLEGLRGNTRPTDKGLGFLEAKFQLLTSYCANIAFFLLARTSSPEMLKNHPVIKELVKNRIQIEKLKPIEAKLKYRIEKLCQKANLAASVMSKETSDDLLSYRPNTKSLMLDDDQSEDDQIYRPPKLAPAFFEDGHEKGKDIGERTINRRLLREMKQEFSSKPEEILEESLVYDVDDVQRHRISKETLFEEENFTRLAQSKKEAKKQRLYSDPLRELDEFSNRALSRSKSEDSVSFDKKNEIEDEEIYSSEDEEYDEEENDVKESADGYYESIKTQKNKSREDKKIKKDTRVYDSFDKYSEMSSGSKRPVGYEIMKNKGLTPHRSKEQRNPRVKQRVRFEKAQKRIKGFKPVTRSEHHGASYAGEHSGIRTDITKSTKFR